MKQNELSEKRMSYTSSSLMLMTLKRIKISKQKWKDFYTFLDIIGFTMVGILMLGNSFMAFLPNGDVVNGNLLQNIKCSLSCFADLPFKMM